MGHNTPNCQTPNKSQQNFHPTTSQPAQIHNTEMTAMPSTPVPAPAPSALTKYVQTLEKTEDEVLQILKLCYKELAEEVAVADTFEVFKESDF